MLIVLAAVALVTHLAIAGTVNKRARLRQGPSKDTALLGWLEAGTAITLEGQQRGWYAVRTDDGRTGYLWQEHIAFAEGEQAGTPSASTTTSAATTLPPTTRPAAVTPPSTTPVTVPPPPAPVDRQDPTASELERLRLEVSRLTTAQTELVTRLSRSGGSGAAAPLASDGSAGAAATFLLAGAFIGLVLGYVIRGRRDRRSRIRL